MEAVVSLASADSLPNLCQIRSFGHHEQSLAATATFPYGADGTLFFRLGKQVNAFVFHHGHATTR